MLLGLAFENVLKGFISLVRLEQDQQPALPSECHIHELEVLAVRPECRELTITADELKVLERLSPYIKWAGRYPVPKQPSDMSFPSAGSRERLLEGALWDRMVSILGDRAWVMKGGPESMGGRRLYMKRSG